MKFRFKKGNKFGYKTRIAKGQKMSNETKIKMSLAKKGHKGYWVGKKFTKEHKDKISKSHFKNGNTGTNQSIRNSIEIRLWRKAVFERDDFTCQKTGIKGGKIIAHHINNFADFPELRTTINNGITLSEESHKRFHKIYGYKNNTKGQLEEFINYY